MEDFFPVSDRYFAEKLLLSAAGTMTHQYSLAQGHCRSDRFLLLPLNHHSAFENRNFNRLQMVHDNIYQVSSSLRCLKQSTEITGDCSYLAKGNSCVCELSHELNAFTFGLCFNSNPPFLWHRSQGVRSSWLEPSPRQQVRVLKSFPLH